ncbi:MAG: photosynthetic reaction center subunit H [Rhodospirillales bacterium 20-64-7]|nr:MAG: photosynthetic reaction center subunit H [Rhodospirillales bacterium 20-64-7]HQT77727.1 photosynthetic reaction center subunit H [Rhodopila sp.]
MQYGAITGYIDVAQVALYAFWIFFAGLIFYLRREDKREGYPLVTERPGYTLPGFPLPPKPKAFLLADGRTVLAPRPEEVEPAFQAQPVAMWPGAPQDPLGNPMLSAAGPAAYALRDDRPDMMQEFHANRVVPLRVATDHHIDEEGPNPIGHEVIAADGVTAGTVADLWIDRAETCVRYVEVALTGGGRVLVPMPLVKVETGGRAFVESVLAVQFAPAPGLANPDQVTLREEDQIQAYFSSGHLYATADRMGPLL